MTNLIKAGVLSYLRLFAKKALIRHKPIVIGIAGSVGKSSTRNAIEAILKDYFSIKSIGNSETGIPLGILGMEPEDYSTLDWATMLIKAPFHLNYLKDTKYLIAEMGIDEPDPPKNMEYLLTILKPDIAISLNVSATHSMQFDKTVAKSDGITEHERLVKVIRNIAKEDIKIITQSQCKVGIYNADDTNISEEVESDKKLQTIKLLTFGSKNKNTMSYGIHSVDLEGSNFQMYLKQGEKNEEINLHFTQVILPEVYREVFAAAILTGFEAGLTIEQIKTSLQTNLTLPKGRSSLFKGINGSVLIDSTYNASKQSTVAFLDLIDKLENKTDRPTVFVFGDMRELGKESKIEHEEVAKRIIGSIDYLYLVGPQTMEFVLPVVQTQKTKFKEIRWFDSAARVGDYLKDAMPEKAVALFKGSQNTIFLEEAVKKVLMHPSDRDKLTRQSDFWMKIKSS